MIKFLPDVNRVLITGDLEKASGNLRKRSQKYGETAIKSFEEYKDRLQNQPTSDILDITCINLKEGSEFRELLNTKDTGNLSDLGLDGILEGLIDLNSKITPPNFTLRYTPEGEFNFLSLISAAFEHLGRVPSKSVKELDLELPEGFSFNGFADENGSVDISRAAAMLVVEDIAKANPKMTKFDPKSVSGMITEDGELNFIASYLDDRNVKNTENLVTQIRKFFNLDKMSEEFKKEVEI